MSNCKQKKPYNPLPEYLTIGPSNIHGAGILAKEDIPAEVVIGITHVYDPNFQHNFIRTPLGGFLNHNDNANCELIEEDQDYHYKKFDCRTNLNFNYEPLKTLHPKFRIVVIVL